MEKTAISILPEGGMNGVTHEWVPFLERTMGAIYNNEFLNVIVTIMLATADLSSSNLFLADRNNDYFE